MVSECIDQLKIVWSVLYLVILLLFGGCVKTPAEHGSIKPGVQFHGVVYLPVPTSKRSKFEEIEKRTSGANIRRRNGFLRICVNILESSKNDEELWNDAVEYMRAEFTTFHEKHGGIYGGTCRYEFVDFAVYVERNAECGKSGWLFGKTFAVDDLITPTSTSETLQNTRGKFKFLDASTWGYEHLGAVLEERARQE